MCYGMRVVGTGILLDGDVSAIKRESRIDLNSSRNLVMMFRGCSGGSGLAVIWEHENFFVELANNERNDWFGSFFYL